MTIPNSFAHEVMAVNHPLHGVMGRKNVDGSFTYRKGDQYAWIMKAIDCFYVGVSTEYPETYPTRKDAIERIEYLLAGECLS